MQQRLDAPIPFLLLDGQQTNHEVVDHDVQTDLCQSCDERGLFAVFCFHLEGWRPERWVFYVELGACMPSSYSMILIFVPNPSHIFALLTAPLGPARSTS